MFKRNVSSAILTAFVTLALVSSAAHAAMVVDTGTPIAGDQYVYVFDNTQLYAAGFSLTGNSIVNSIQSYFTADVGSVGFSVYSDAGSLPGSLLYSSSLSTTSAAAFTSTPSWQGVSSLNWSLAAGDYWLAITPTWSNANPFAGIPSSAPSPLASYLQNQGSGWQVPAEPLALGVRIDATVSAVPEPTTITMYALGLAGLAAVARRKKS